MMINDDVMIC